VPQCAGDRPTVESVRTGGRARIRVVFAKLDQQSPGRSEDLIAILMFGPLYHITERAERIRALSEAKRVVRPEGILAAAAISRFASLLDGLVSGWLGDPAFDAIVDRDLAEGQHRNPTSRPG
jgi:hypothetical protein